MVDEIDIWRTANLLIQQHAENASLEAALRADKAIEQGDPEGERVWVQITKAVNVLLEKPMAGESKH